MELSNKLFSDLDTKIISNDVPCKYFFTIEGGHYVRKTNTNILSNNMFSFEMKLSSTKYDMDQILNLLNSIVITRPSNVINNIISSSLKQIIIEKSTEIKYGVYKKNEYIINILESYL